MRRFLVLMMVVALLSAFAVAQNSQNASAKAVAQFTKTLTACDSTLETGACDNQVTVFKTQIKTNNVNDLFVAVSLQTGLYTKTQVKGNTSGSQTAAGSTAVAQAGVEVDLLLDGKTVNVNPGSNVIFDSRIQMLNASIGNIFTDCFANGLKDGTGVSTCEIIPEQITLAQETAGAHTFNWILPNVGVGTHTIEVKARVAAKVDDVTMDGSVINTTIGNVAVSKAWFGLGSLSVESVRLNDALPLVVY